MRKTTALAKLCAAALTTSAKMLDALEIRKEIARLEYEPSSYQNYDKLAALYIIRSEMQKQPETIKQEAPRNELTVTQSSAYDESEFLRRVSASAPDAAWRVMDELMESLSVMQPKTYAAVMAKLSEL